MAFYTYLSGNELAPQGMFQWAKKLISDLNKRDQQLFTLINNITTGGAAAIVRLYGSLDGRPTAGQELFDIEMVGDEVFPAGLVFNSGSYDVAPSSNITSPIYVNDVQVGSMNGSVGSRDATWVMLAEYRAAAKDKLRFNAPTPQDPTMSGPRYTYIGTRTV